MKKLTHEEFLQKVYDVHGVEYSVSTIYDGMKQLITVTHETCGRTYDTLPTNLLTGGCIKCGYKKTKQAQRKTHEQFISEVESMYKGKYTLIDRYVNNTTKLKFYHSQCDFYFYCTPRDFLQGKGGCPSCKNERISKGVTKSHEHFIKRLGNSLGEDYQILSKYKNGRTKIKVKHLKCGLIFESLPGHILEGKRCPECWKEDNGKRFRKSHDQFKKDLGCHWFEWNELLDEYVTQQSKVRVKHKQCGSIFKVTPDSLLRGSGCPRCKESRGEKEISSFLNSRKIPYVPQFKFDDCFYKDKLSYDFALKNKNGEVIGLIEYQGIQHYEPVDFFGGERSFEIQKEKDKIKREYAKINNIPLYEIRYDENVDEKLSKLIPR